MDEKEFFATWCGEKSAFSIRILNLQNRFRTEFHELPDFYVRVPGRVNLIGEHVDYCGYSVCPMAIQPDIIVAIKVNHDSTIRIINTDNVYKDMENDINNLKFSTHECSSPFWADYILCGIKGVSEMESVDRSKISGLYMLVSGVIPPCAGLSSSSALVCAGALAITFAFKLPFSKSQLADICARSERFIGTEGGGMDQAIIFCAHKGSASYISFNPLHISKIDLPSNGTFVIAQSLVTKNKAASADFNTRVVECRLASLIIGKNTMAKWKPIMLLSEVQNEIKAKYEDMIKLVEQYLPKLSYTKQEISEMLNISSDELEKNFLTQNTKFVTEFKIRQRALHVIHEAYRVEKFCTLCSQKANCIEELGKLMIESHESLKTLYECSHPQLNRLVSCCLQNGAYGARLTGAGWGGCVVALVDSTKSKEFVNAIKVQFYRDLAPKDADLDNLIFATKPFSGASVITEPLED